MTKKDKISPDKVAEATAEYKVATPTKADLAEQRIPVRQANIAVFCKRWKIVEFSLFGSVLREDFRPDSDVDVLVSFQPDAKWSLWDLTEMQEELETMFGRKVDLVEKEALRNPYRRHSILTKREILYVL